MCTEKQRKYIYWLSGQLDRKIDEDAIREYSIKDASEIIEAMTKDLKEVAATNGNIAERPKGEFVAQRFGMCVKIVANDLIANNHSLYTQNFKDDIEKLYNVVTNVEKKLSSSSREF